MASTMERIYPPEVEQLPAETHVLETEPTDGTEGPAVEPDPTLQTEAPAPGQPGGPIAAMPSVAAAQAPAPTPQPKFALEAKDTILEIDKRLAEMQAPPVSEAKELIAQLQRYVALHEGEI